MNNITHNVSGISVPQRVVDGYINATAMSTAHKQSTGKQKNVADWLRNKRTQESLKHLESNMGIPIFELYQVFEGSSENGGGTWLHPKLSVRFAMWLSDDFGFQVESWVEEWMTTAKNPIAQQTQAATPELPVVMPTQKELDYIRSRACEKAEMMGHPVSSEVVKRKTGFARAAETIRQFREQAEKRAIESGGDE